MRGRPGVKWAKLRVWAVTNARRVTLLDNRGNRHRLAASMAGGIPCARAHHEGGFNKAAYRPAEWHQTVVRRNFGALARSAVAR